MDVGDVVKERILHTLENHAKECELKTLLLQSIQEELANELCEIEFDLSENSSPILARQIRSAVSDVLSLSRRCSTKINKISDKLDEAERFFASRAHQSLTKPSNV
jgi:hypothetical protein